MPRGTKPVLVTLGLMAIALFVVPFFVPWTPINCQYQDVDINTGRIRTTHYLAFCKTYERVHETPLSKALPRQVVDGVQPDWRRVNTFSPGLNHSPHHTFHGAIHQIRSLERIWEVCKASDSVKRRTAMHVLALWRYGNTYFMAEKYLDAFQGFSEDSKRDEIFREVEKLEMPLDRVDGEKVTRTVFYPNGRPMERAEGYYDPKKRFVKHGVCETWYDDGKRELYGHFQNGELHGRRFQWNRDGKLSAIEALSHNQLTEFESEGLEKHPAFKSAQELVKEEGNAKD